MNIRHYISLLEEGKVISLDVYKRQRPVEICINPSFNQAYRMIQDSDDYGKIYCLRGITLGSDVYIWRAKDATHFDVETNLTDGYDSEWYVTVSTMRDEKMSFDVSRGHGTDAKNDLVIQAAQKFAEELGTEV